ncbi:hypothetical protein EYF80_058670 [Liparis tanakae]|uniref:Uncharacterized protein n=1 Tax=Liparis tanakae TaxID=230148 RepID=A0A4Z2EQQ9_9TELE|nr:hypothetical protein EYF80_058670 [Liparis tanakae]
MKTSWRLSGADVTDEGGPRRRSEGRGPEVESSPPTQPGSDCERPYPYEAATGTSLVGTAASVASQPVPRVPLRRPIPVRRRGKSCCAETLNYSQFTRNTLLLRCFYQSVTRLEQTRIHE